MRPVRLVKAFLFGTLLVSGLAFAGRNNVKEFTPTELTPEQIEAEKAASRSNLNGYAEGVTEKTTPVPWMAIGILSAILLGAAPFAIRAYLRTSAEIAPSQEAHASAGQRRRGADDE